MSHTTEQQATTEQTCAALVVLADYLATAARDCAVSLRPEYFPTLSAAAAGQPMVYVSFGNLGDALTVVGGMSGPVEFRETAGESYLRKSWRGNLTEGWNVCVIHTIYGVAPLVAVEGDPAADLLADATTADECRACGKPGYHPDTCPTVPADDEHQDVDTSPATAAAEQPAGPVSSWPAVVPAPRPPAEMLPTPSWAAVGRAAVMAEPYTPLVYPRPVTDPALAGHDLADVAGEVA